MFESLKKLLRRTPENKWEYETRLGVYVPVGMRRKRPDGTWEHREATEEEIKEYMEAEAW